MPKHTIATMHKLLAVILCRLQDYDKPQHELKRLMLCAIKTRSVVVVNAVDRLLASSDLDDLYNVYDAIDTLEVI